MSAAAPVVAVRRVIGDLETPVSAFLKLAAGRRFPFLLESVEGGETLGRYSMIGADPDILWRADRGRAAMAEGPDAPFTDDPRPPLESLRALVDASRLDLPADVPPMGGGLFGYLGWAMAREIERLPEDLPRAVDVPDALFVRPQLVAVFDSVRREIVLVSAIRPRAGQDADAVRAAAEARVAAAAADLAGPLPAQAAPPGVLGPLRSNTDPEAYRERVRRAKAHIAAGDIFQAVLSQRFSADFPASPFRLYRALRRTNPSPFLFYLDFEAFALVGSSPEILVRVRDGEIAVRPIAGTRPRGATPAADKAAEADLLADPKERAEHLMLLDLGRNDVGRAAEIGSVRATEQFVIERYSHVMHIVSHVTGRLRAGLHPLDAVAAGFPAGTVSGAPKIRAMEIIADLEAEARGPYAGAIGYFGADGDVDTCIALRTALVKDGVMHVQAGAGVVADSDPEAERLECEAKARALFAAAGIALNEISN